MKRIIAISTLSLLMTSISYIKAQDFHLSQFESCPLVLNPALTGNYLDKESKFRVSANYRSQWKSIIGTPYSSSHIGLDLPYGNFGFGLYAFNTRAGASLFNTTNIMLSASYEITIDKTEVHNLTTGLQLGVFSKSFRTDDLYFDSQYSLTDGIQQEIPSGENLSDRSIFRFDANFSVAYRHNDKQAKVNPFGGFSVFHATMPNESFTTEKQRLAMRFILYGGSDIRFNDDFHIRPRILLMRQGSAYEYYISSLAFYKIKDTEYEPMAGIGYRYKDAIVINLGLKQGRNLFQISYDINTSYLSNFSNGRGAIEFSVIYFGTKELIKPPNFY